MFLAGKQKDVICGGFEPTNMGSHLFPFQRFTVERACRAGKYAIFANTGLGKTIQFLEWGTQVYNHTNDRTGGKPVLVVSPLAVVRQSVLEGKKFGYDIREIDINTNKVDMGECPMYITNYEQVEKLNVSDFVGVILDESSILKNFTGKTKRMLIDMFARVQYKLACTATPSPNDVMELTNHAEFLDVMSRTEMLSMYFVHDSGKTSDWRLKGHAETAFWDFVSSWAIMYTKPSDIGFSDEGYNLPPLNIEEVYTETKKQNNGMLFNDVVVSATELHKVIKLSEDERVAKVIDVVRSKPNESFIIWTNHDSEGVKIRQELSDIDVREVKGSDDREYKMDTYRDFANGHFPILITKLKMASMGLNFQNCHNQIFCALDFSFERTYQGIRRSYRFGQKHQVNCYLIVTDTMQNVRSSIIEKQRQFEKMQDKMSKATNRNIGIESNLRERGNSTINHIELPTWIRL